ncbi:MAG TPA: hypothetical protein ENN87_12660 [Phycisphaerales bacterium]|nr:hypothetical protein [Phycisphaerales bacterium]
MWLVITVFLVLVFCVMLARWAPGTALLSSPILGLVCIGLAVSTVPDGPSVVGLSLALLIFPVTVIRLKLLAVRLSRPRWPYVVADWVLRIGYYLLCLGLLILVFQPFGPILFALFIAFNVQYIRTKRRTTTLHVLQALATAMRQNLPLCMALDSAAQDETSPARKPLKGIVEWLRSGYSLSRAVRLGYPKCPREVLVSLEAGERVGRLGEVVESTLRDITEQIDRRRRIRSSQVAFLYPLVVTTVALLIMMAMLTFITPLYADVVQGGVSEEYQSLPASTLLVLRCGKFLHAHAAAIGIGVVLAVLLWLVIYVTTWRFGNRAEPTAWQRMADVFRWHLPVERRLERIRARLQAVRILRSALRAGHTVDFALAVTAREHVNGCFARQLRRWHEAVVNGQPPAEAARRAGVGSPLAWAFDDRLHPGGCPERLEMLEESYRSAHDYSQVLLRSTVGPMMILLLGGMVGLFAHALFMPLIDLIRVMSGMAP